MAVYPIFPGGKRKAFTMSFDDAWPEDRPLIQMMNRYGIKGTFNLNSGEKKFTDIPDPRELYAGHEVAVHGLTHAYLERVAPQTATYEVMKDRENLERVFGGSIRGFAYPYTAYNQDTPQILKNCGIAYARTANNTGKFMLPSDWYYWHPTCTCDSRTEELLACGDRFLATDPIFNQSWVFYVYGHANRLSVGDHWAVIEELFQKIGGREDIWYATNIEIYDYIAAFKSLIMSVDSNYIYNPTMTTLSLIYSDQDFINSAITLELKPGEHVYLQKN